MDSWNWSLACSLSPLASTRPISTEARDRAGDHALQIGYCSLKLILAAGLERSDALIASASLSVGFPENTVELGRLGPLVVVYQVNDFFR
jgi:hypothetical protein